MYPAEKIDTRSYRSYRDLIWVKLKMQVASQELLDARQQSFQFRPIPRQEHEVVGIPNIRLDLECVLHELVKLVHIDNHQELRSEVP